MSSTLGIGATTTIRLGNQLVQITLQVVELGERVPVQVDADRRIYATFTFINRGDMALDFNPLTVFAGLPASLFSSDRANSMDPTDPVHLDPDVLQSVRWRWRISTNRGIDGALPAQTVWLTLNAPINPSGPYVTVGSDSVVYRIDLPGEPATSNSRPGIRTTQVPTTTALPPGTPLPRR